MYLCEYTCRLEINKHVSHKIVSSELFWLMAVDFCCFFFLFVQQVVYEAQELLDKQDGVTPVHNRFYELSSNYHKLMGNHAEYYRDALRFLGCTELTTIPSKTRVGFSFIHSSVKMRVYST